jgi:hypothetical protein
MRMPDEDKCRLLEKKSRWSSGLTGGAVHNKRSGLCVV